MAGRTRADLTSDLHGQLDEIEEYADAAVVLVRVFEHRHDGRPSQHMCERNLCRAMLQRDERFREYCQSLPPAAVAAGLANTATETLQAQGRQQWARIQLAAHMAQQKAA
jgi:hypothetical protein